jgi:ATP adenylyltransferase
MDRLWAPWRKQYILGKKRSRCILCHLRRSTRDRRNLVLFRSRHCYAVLNLFPYNNGHVMIVPNRHVKNLYNLSDAELLDLWKVNNKVTQKIQKRMKPQGMNMGINFGRVGGAGVPGHLHVHVVPRWVGDSNCMPMIARTKVLSESLSSVYKKLSMKAKR